MPLSMALNTIQIRAAEDGENIALYQAVKEYLEEVNDSATINYTARS